MGNGAFMKTISEAKDLGELLKTVGELYGLKVSICFTDMNQPLGNTAGLWCEVIESVECMKGNGPYDLMQVVYHLGEKALEIAGIENSKEKLKSNIKNGKALKKFKEKLDPRKCNGAIFIGLQNPVVKSHGGTDAVGFAHSINVCNKIVKSDLIDKIKLNLINIDTE